ncbi:MAG: hypothetical protein QOK11_3344, partial [Pseudonocardiales bacterium]|nr:hypothetical protein [Pseudonocardiales bacterium]
MPAGSWPRPAESAPTLEIVPDALKPSRRAAAARALVQLLRDAARLDRTQSDPVVSLRNALGVTLPL